MTTSTARLGGLLRMMSHDSLSKKRGPNDQGQRLETTRDFDLQTLTRSGPNIVC
jgi:hypothetical protein